MTLSLPAGYTVRPVVRADAEAVLAIVHENSLARDGTTESTLQSVYDEWDDPDLNLAHDTCVVIAADGRLIGYVGLWGRGREALPFADLCVPHRDTATEALAGPFLLGWAEDRTWKAASAIAPDIRIAVRVFSDSRDIGYIDLLTACGFIPIRHNFRMGLTFDGPPDAGRCPDGFTLRPAEPEDMAAAFDAYHDAWRDHFGYIERPLDIAFESWAHEWQKDFKPGLWVLGMDGDTVAGMCLNLSQYGGDESVGYVMRLAVRRAYRRRGLAEALLRRSLADFYAAGKRSAILHVDGESLTGATRLYERAGMHVEKTYTLCEKELRPGKDPSTQEAGQV
ncbi:MAG: GNAT family N-acetyltransferase [Anaerolineae bacterium]